MANLRHVLIILEIDILVFDTAPKPLHEDVVEGPPATIHAQAHMGCQERCLEARAGELNPLVGIEYIRLLGRQCPLHERHTKVGFQAY